jgi:N-acyl-D-aspartate/D-glutamate deacylase
MIRKNCNRLRRIASAIVSVVIFRRQDNEMAELSLVVRDALIVDGSGEPGFRGDVGIHGDRIAMIGRVEAADVPVIDARGRVLAPGFIDVHTHYDPQLCWDKTAMPTPEHGVTSIVIGNCSVSLAPAKPEHRATITRLFGVIEDIFEDTFEAAVPFSWQSFPEYLESLRPGLGLNVSPLIGHSMLRYYVMGTAARERAATDAEIAAMAAVLEEAMRAGGVGLSMTYVHKDERGEHLPCHYADLRELRALCRAMMRAGRGVLEIAPNTPAGLASLETIDLMGQLSLETGIVGSLDGIVYSPTLGDLWKHQLERLEQWQRRGARVYAQVLVRSMDQVFSLAGNVMHLTRRPVWDRILTQGIEGRVQAFGDASLRPQLVESAAPMKDLTEQVRIREIFSAENEGHLGRHLTEIAAEQGKTPIDAMLDIALADGLQTLFGYSGVTHADPEIVGELLRHPLVQVGAGDAGAHVSQFAGAGDTSYLFERFVRERGAMSVERAVQRLTSELARQWQIRDRGEIALGRYADLVLFDPDTIARGEEIRVSDVPGGGSRYVRRPAGIDKVIVNGAVLVDNGDYTEARAGQLV